MNDELAEVLRDLCAMSHLVMSATRRDFPDGREAMVTPRMYNAIITVGPAGMDWFADSWRYRTTEDAVRALTNWDPATQPEPDGWFRNATTGRRRVAIFDDSGKRGYFEYFHW